MPEISTIWIVSYTDTVHTVEGSRKTRHYATFQEAERAVERLTGREEITDVQITKQKTTVERTIIK